MGLESGNRIEDLVDTNPLATDDVSEGDDHLRLIKTCVQGSFPSLGATACDRTGVELNKAITTVFGRSGPDDIEATEGDYNLGQMGDVTLSGQNDGQQLIRRSGEWVNDRVVRKTGQYNTWNGFGDGDKVRASNTITDGTVAGLINISPNNANGFQAVVQSGVSCYFEIGVTLVGVVAGTSPNYRLGIGKNASSSSFPGGGVLLASDSCYAEGTGAFAQAFCYATVRLSENDVINIFLDAGIAPTYNNIHITTCVWEA